LKSSSSMLLESQQTKMDLNGQKWIRFVRIKSRFWFFWIHFYPIKVSAFF